MTENKKQKQYDLEDRTFNFAKRVRAFVKRLPKTIANIEDGKQVIKASGSVGANYIEANESLSNKDFIMRVKISKKDIFLLNITLFYVLKCAQTHRGNKNTIATRNPKPSGPDSDSLYQYLGATVT